MSILIRRIAKGKWKDYCDHNASEPWALLHRLFHFPHFNAPADAITNCLKTTNNKLSVWLLPDETKLNDVLLALSTGAKSNGLSTIDFIRIDTLQLDEIGLSYAPSIEDADTAISDLRELHFNISGFDYRKLGHFQDIVVEIIKKNHTERKRETELKPLIQAIIKDDRLDFSYLSADYKNYLKKVFPREEKIPNPESETLYCPYCGKSFLDYYSGPLVK